jgi:hypothetical protein
MITKTKTIGRRYVYRLELEITTHNDGRQTIRRAVAKRSTKEQYLTSPQFGRKMIIPGTLILEAATLTFIPEVLPHA